jgi:competence protein ComGC
MDGTDAVQATVHDNVQVYVLLHEKDAEIARLVAEMELLKIQLNTEKDGEVSDLREEVSLLRSQFTENDRQIVELHTFY